MRHVPGPEILRAGLMISAELDHQALTTAMEVRRSAA
jgi:hypothetical protein